MSDDISLELQRQINDLKKTQKDLRTWEFPKYFAAKAYSQFQSLPATRGFWPFTSINESASIIDMSGQGRTLTAAGAPTFGVMTNGGAYAVFNGSTTYYYRADEAGLDITGNLTLMAWASCAASTEQVIASKANTNQISYQINTTNANYFQVIVSSNGSALTKATANMTYTAGEWYFVAGVYEASTSLKIHWGPANLSSAAGGLVTNTTSIPAALHNGTAQFRIGANQIAGYLSGRASYVWLGSYALPDGLISDVYEGTRDLFAA